MNANHSHCHVEGLCPVGQCAGCLGLGWDPGPSRTARAKS